MEIKQVVVGSLETNCYILSKNYECLIIDPGDEATKIINDINGKVLAIIITHYHFDHIGALDELKAKYKVPVIDYNNIGENNIGDFQFKIIPTKGHTNDSITVNFENENIMFCGDFIFKDGIGRTDLPTGNMFEMIKSIKKLLTYNENTILYPGHYEKTSIKKEKENLEYIIKYY